MANFSISTKKILSASNIKRIIMLGISLKNGIESIEQDLIKEYDTTKTYSPDMAVYYNDYLYRCLFTTTGEFDINSWKKVGDSLELVNKAQVEAMLGLTPDELDTLANIILDSEVRLDKTWSSSKIYADLQQCLSDSKKFTLDQFAKANKASYNVVSATSEMTDKSVIYLMSNNTNYDMYIVEESGTPTKIGDTKIDLSQYAKLSDLNNYYDKTTSDGKYATITTVDGKVDKTSILTTISTTATNKQVFGAKAVYDTFNQKCDRINLYELKDSTNNNKAKHMIIDIPKSHSISGKTTRLFFTDNISSIGFQIWNGDILEKDYRTPLINPNHIYIDSKTLTPVNSKVNFTNIDSSCDYMVINGICYVNIWSMNITGDLSVETIFSGLPTAKVSAQFILSNDVGSKTVGMGWIDRGSRIIVCNAKLEIGNTKSQGYARFSYPIDESWIPSEH